MKTYLLIAFICCAIALVITYLLTHSARPLPAPPKTPEPAPAPLPDLPISCFVKGLIVSLETEPLEWRPHYPICDPYNTDLTRYIKDDVTLGLSWEITDRTGNRVYSARIVEPSTQLNRTEQGAFLKAIVNAYYAHSAKKLAAKEVEDAKIRAPFEALGCPDESRAQ